MLSRKINNAPFFQSDELTSYFNRTRRNQFWIGGVAGQEKIRQAKIGVAGLGGMGSQISELLVRFGVGEIRIADPDIIEETNLNRQVIANLKTVGQSKAVACENELKNIDRNVIIKTFTEGITEDNVEKFVDGCDIIIDEIDVFPLKRHIALHKAARKRNLPIYSSYVVGLGIRFYKFHGNEFTFEDFLGNNPEKWDAPTGDYLLNTFGTPFPSYLDSSGINKFKDEIETGAIPIFGPSTLLGQSLVVTRVILDFLKMQKVPVLLDKQFIPTPTMPEYISLDPVDLSLKVCRVD